MAADRCGGENHEDRKTAGTGIDPFGIKTGKTQKKYWSVAVGQDCAALEVGEDEVLVMSTDPITGTAKDLGHHSIHITANDLAAAGADPVGVMLTVMLPDTVEEPEIRKMMQDAEETCEKLHMEILGGHTEITNVVKQPLISVTGVGKMKKRIFARYPRSVRIRISS